MKKYLVISIDVEPDCTYNWTYSSPLSFDGVKTGIRKILQPFFNRHGIVPTYLINNVVLEDAVSVDVFRKLEGNYELGTHLHPEFILPDKKFEDYAGKKGEANSCFYPPEVEFQKIKNITALFHQQLGYLPTSFRAGRFSAGSNTIKSLIALNYKVDTSVTPNVRWDDRTRERPVDFRLAPPLPYRVNENSIIEASAEGTLLEVPVSISLKKLSPVRYLQYIRRNKRIPFKASRAVWLRPVFSSTSDFTFVLQKISSDNAQAPVIVYNMMFHNVEVMPGLSPYTKTEEDCNLYLQSLEWLFRYCRENDIESIALSNLYDIIGPKK